MNETQKDLIGEAYLRTKKAYDLLDGMRSTLLSLRGQSDEEDARIKKLLFDYREVVSSIIDMDVALKLVMIEDFTQHHQKEK